MREIAFSIIVLAGAVFYSSGALNRSGVGAFGAFLGVGLAVLGIVGLVWELIPTLPGAAAIESRLRSPE